MLREQIVEALDVAVVTEAEVSDAAGFAFCEEEIQDTAV